MPIAKITFAAYGVERSFEVDVGSGRTIDELKRNIEGIVPDRDDRFQKTGTLFYGIFSAEGPPMLSFASELKSYMDKLSKTDFFLRDDIDFLYMAEGVVRGAKAAGDLYAAGIIASKVSGYFRKKKFFIQTDLFDVPDKYFMPIEPVSKK